MKKNYRIKKTISMKQFISEFGESFSHHMKKRLMDLEVRCVLTRKEDYFRFDLKHVEHIQHGFDMENGLGTGHKEYAYGQLSVIDGILYFSEKCCENADVMEAPIVRDIYESINSEGMINETGINAKKVDDSNIDYIIDSILTVCPQVSQAYMDIMSKYIK